MSVTIEDIEALRRVLTELPRHQPKEVSKQEAIALLSSEIGAARRRGYTPDELARIFSERGVAINAATLRGYLRRNRKGRKGEPGKPTTDQRDAAVTPPPPARSEPGTRTTLPAPASPLSPPRVPVANAIPSSRAAGGDQGGSTPAARPPGDSSGGTSAQAGRK